MRLLFPNRCPCCDGVLSLSERERGICTDCIPQVAPIYGRVCHRCGKLLRPGLGDVCPDCEGREFFFLQHRALYLYSGGLKQAMYRLKYGNRRVLADFFAREAARRWGGWLRERGVEVIVPVPMYRKKQRQRGYNQAQELARCLGGYLGLPMESRLVERVRPTQPQKGLSRQKRYENLKNAFKIKKSVVEFTCVLVVDDIYTTGATLSQVAKALRQAGVARVYGLSICIGSSR